MNQRGNLEKPKPCYLMKKNIIKLIIYKDKNFHKSRIVTCCLKLKPQLKRIFRKINSKDSLKE